MLRRNGRLAQSRDRHVCLQGGVTAKRQRSKAAALGRGGGCKRRSPKSRMQVTNRHCDQCISVLATTWDSEGEFQCTRTSENNPAAPTGVSVQAQSRVTDSCKICTLSIGGLGSSWCMTQRSDCSFAEMPGFVPPKKVKQARRSGSKCHPLLPDETSTSRLGCPSPQGMKPNRRETSRQKTK